MEHHFSNSASAYDNSLLYPSWPWPLPPHSSSSSSSQVSGFPSWSASIQEPFIGFPSSWSQDSAQHQAASLSKSHSHSQAEKRRRDRINAQLGTLRKLIPKSDKMDKAALLGSVIDHVKELKGKAMEVSKAITIPTELDEVTVDVEDSYDIYGNKRAGSSSSSSEDKENVFIRASVCCDDRPEVFSELIRALKGLRLSIVRADIASVGGRVKSILVLCNKDWKEGGEVSLNTIKQSLNVVLSRISSSSTMPSNFRVRSKRQRFFLPSQ